MRTTRVIAGPVAAPLGDEGVRVSTFDADAADFLSALTRLFGTTKRRSLLPGRSFPMPSPTEPRLAPNVPSPLDETISRIARAFAESLISSGPKTSIAGGTSALGTGTTVPGTVEGAGAVVGAAGVLKSTVSFVLTVKSAAFTLVEGLVK